MAKKLGYVTDLPPELTQQSTGGYPLGQVFISDRGHEVTVVAVDRDEVTFGFTRSFKGETETRQRSVPRSQVKYFLKSYKPVI